MSSKPSLSPSKITTYLACPVKYKWTYVDGRGKWFMRAKSYYSFGYSLHNVLQRFHDSGDVGVQTVEQAIAALEDNWISAGYSSPEEAQEAFAEGREVLATYIEQHEKRDITTSTLFVEKRLKMDLGSFYLIGRVDRVDEYEDGTLEIIDYKSGRSKTDIDEIKNDIAMNCYQLLVRSMLPDKRVLSTIIALRTHERASYEPSEEELSEFAMLIKELGVEIINRDYENIKPSYKELCGGCDFLRLCLKDEEFKLEHDMQAKK